LIERIVAEASIKLEPLMEHAFSGFTYGDACGEKCLIWQNGEFIGRGDTPAAPPASDAASAAPTTSSPDAAAAAAAPAAAAGGRKMLQEHLQPADAAAQRPAASIAALGGDISEIQRGTFVYFYRNMEGHHLWTVGLELMLDVSSFNPQEWRVVSVYFADMVFESVDQLMGAFNGTALGPEGQNVTEKVRGYTLHMPGRLPPINIFCWGSFCRFSTELMVMQRGLS
jgi:hypothetical protein